MQATNPITITNHAKQRLQERAPHIAPSSYKSFVHNARYYGLTKTEIDHNYPTLSNEVFKNIRLNTSTEFRVYKGYVFAFVGSHCKNKVLKTIIEIKSEVVKEQLPPSAYPKRG